MTKLDDAKIEAIFNRADGFVHTIDKALEDLETAITKGDYPAADKAFGTAYQTLMNDLEDVISEDIARMCDAINPAVDIHQRASEAEKLGTELNEQLTKLQIGLDHEDDEAVTTAFDKAFDAAVRIREIVEDDVSVLLDKIDHDYGASEAKERAENGLSGNEVKKLLMALGRGQSEFSDKQAERLVDWAREIRISNVMLDLILEGRAVPSINADGDVTLEAVD